METKTTLSLQEEFSFLIKALKLHLVEEFPQGSQLPTNSETFSYFKREAKEDRVRQTKTPVAPAEALQIKEAPKLSVIAPKVHEAPKAQTVTKKDAPTKPKAVAKEVRAAKNPQEVTTETLPAITSDSLADIMQWVSKLFPNLLILDIPNDAEAKKMKEYWRHNQMQPAIVILVDSSTSAFNRTFIESIAKGINERLAPAVIRPWEKTSLSELLKSPALKLILFTQELESHLKGCSIPIIPLANLELCSTDAGLKKLLWQRICHTYRTGGTL